MNYYYTYLKNYLLEDGHRIVGFDKSILDDEDALNEFLTERSDAASKEFEESCRSGYDGFGAQELAMETLLADLKELEATEEETKAEEEYQKQLRKSEIYY